MTYLGVEKNEIITALKDAEQFIRSLGLGPETSKALNERIQENGAYKSLEKAQKDVQITRALNDGGLTEQYRRMADIFRYHAATEKDERIQNLFNRLSAFGTFSGFTTHEYRATDAEEQQYLLKKYIAHYMELSNETAFQDVVDGFIQRNPKRD